MPPILLVTALLLAAAAAPTSATGNFGMCGWNVATSSCDLLFDAPCADVATWQRCAQTHDIPEAAGRADADCAWVEEDGGDWVCQLGGVDFCGGLNCALHSMCNYPMSPLGYGGANSEEKCDTNDNNFGRPDSYDGGWCMRCGHHCSPDYTGPDCAACPSGKYKATHGSVTCTSCQGNSNTVGTGSTASSECACNAGYTGTTSCSACDAGKYKIATGSASCTACESGKTSPTGSDAAADCTASAESNSAVFTPISQMTSILAAIVLVAVMSMCVA